MMWLNAKQYAYVVRETADWTLQELVDLTVRLANVINQNAGLGQIKQMLENVASGGGV